MLVLDVVRLCVFVRVCASVLVCVCACKCASDRLDDPPMHAECIHLLTSFTHFISHSIFHVVCVCQCVSVAHFALFDVVHVWVVCRIHAYVHAYDGAFDPSSGYTGPFMCSWVYVCVHLVRVYVFSPLD